MSKVIVTGGSGFIGTAFVDSLLESGYQVLSLDSRSPQNEQHRGIFRKIDLLDAGTLKEALEEFEPDLLVNLGARTDLDGKSLDDYAANIAGVENIVAAVAETASVKRAIFASTKLVCAGGYHPKSDVDYCPDTLYGASKVEGEKILRNDSSLKCPWCIVRPTSIWGPWFAAPYRGFFTAIYNGYYFHLGRCNPPRSFGYIGNVIFQLNKIMAAPDDSIHRKTFYLTDYDEFTIRDWANTISIRLKGRPARSIPEFVLQGAAVAGDCLKAVGWKNPPMTSFRLRNMRLDTSSVPLDSIKEITGPSLPYTMEQGVEQTIEWMKQRKLI